MEQRGTLNVHFLTEELLNSFRPKTEQSWIINKAFDLASKKVD